MDGHIIVSAPQLRYFGVMIDALMTFQEHLNRASERAMKAIFALSRIMSNIGGYNALWGPNMGWDKAANVAKSSSYRISALRVACSYRTVSYDAMCNFEYDSYRAASPGKSISTLFYTRRKILSVNTQYKNDKIA